MKKILALLIVMMFSVAALFAQAPEKFTYQAVVRNANNGLVSNTLVGVRVSILQSSDNGSVVYSETHSVNSNSNGLITLNIGDGSVEQGSFESIDWASAPFFLKTEIDLEGGSNYTITSIQQLLSVPYALYAKNAGNTFSGDYNDLNNKPTNVSAFVNDAGYITMDSVQTGMTGNQTGDIMYWNAATNSWIMMPAGTTGQVLTMENSIPKWGNLPEYATMILPPTVITTDPIEITQSSALCGGEITSDGNVQLTACGVCWSTHHSPTIIDAHTSNDLSVSVFTSHITELVHNTTYYVRAYASNSIGTTYGAEMSFSTEDIPSGSLEIPAPCSADSNAPTITFADDYLICAGSDSIDLVLNNYQYGSIQWQYSTDTVSWFDIPGGIDTLLTYKPEQTQFVRAMVSYANCPPEYSPVKLLQKTPIANAGISRTVNIGDTVRLAANMEEEATGSWQILQGASGMFVEPEDASTWFFGTDSLYRLRWTLTNSCGTSSDDISVQYVNTVVSDRVVMVDTTDIIFSDSAQMAQGFYMISFSDSSITIGDSTILVSLVNGGFLRKVESWSMADDSTYAMYTSQASLYDVLESGVIQFDNIFGDNNADSAVYRAAPTQDVSYLDHIPTRQELRDNPEMFRAGRVYILPTNLRNGDGSMVNMSADPSLRGGNQQVRGHNADTTLKWFVAEWAPDFSYKLENVEFYLDASPTFELNKENRSLKFGIYGANLHLKADFIPKITAAGEFTGIEWDKPIAKVPFAVPVGPVVIPFTVECGIILSAKGNIEISEEVRYKIEADANFTRGVCYWGKSNTVTVDRSQI